MKILFISTLSLATNPRLYKEIMLAKSAGYTVEIICFEFNNWSYNINRMLLKSLGEQPVHLIQGNRKPLLQWGYSVLTETLNRMKSGFIKLGAERLSQAVTRRSDLLLRQIDYLEGPFDLVIGHNPGALYPTCYASRKFNCACGFDVEDYHPGEGDNRRVQHLTKGLMNQYLSLMDYVTFAAPLVKDLHRDDVDDERGNWEIILNLFPGEQFVLTTKERDEPLEIVWFSQNVNFRRGLEQWIPALEYFKDEMVLTLIGNKKEPFYSEFIDGNSFINYMEPMEQSALNRRICACDIGLAVEAGKDHNNDVALSNKLLTYYQAGLYILATDTPGQKEFLKGHPHSGMIISADQEGFMEKLAQIIASKDSIRRTKAERFKNAQKFNWETESDKLLKLWGEVVGGHRNWKMSL